MKPYERHAFICQRLAGTFDDDRPIGAVTRTMRALAAPLPTNKRSYIRARKRGRLPAYPRQSAAAPVAVCWHGTASLPRTQLQVLATACPPTVRSMASDCP